jgi:hypothetical protein
MFAGKVSKCIPVLSYPLRSVYSPLFVHDTPQDTQPYREIQYAAHPSLALPSSIMNFPSAEELFASGGLEREEESSSTLSTFAMIEQFLWWKVVAGQKY